MSGTVTTTDLARLFDTTPKTIADLGKRAIMERAGRGRWKLQASVTGYVRHLRAEAAGRGSDAAADVRAKLASAQADVAAEKVKAMRRELLTAPTLKGHSAIGGVRGTLPRRRSNRGWNGYSRPPAAL